MSTELRIADADWGYRFGVEGTMKINDASEHFGIPRSTLWEWIKRRRLRVSKVHGRNYLCVKSILDLMSEGEL